MKPLRLIPVIALALSAATSLHAQDAPPPPWEFTSDLGFVNASGNTSVTTLNVGERLIRRLSRWEFTQDFGVTYGRTDGEESSNFWRAGLRSDYSLSERFALYGRVGFDRNRFAGISRRFNEGIGGVARLLNTSANEWNLEAGFETTQQRDLVGVNDNFASLRAATLWKHKFSENAHFLQTVEVLPNLDVSEDLRVNTESTLVAPLSTRVGLTISYVVRYDNLPAFNSAGTERLKKSDRILSTGIRLKY